MKALERFSENLLLIMGLAIVGYSLPMINVTAEDFKDMKEISVRSNETLIGSTGYEDFDCGACFPYYTYEKVGDGNPHQNFVITQKGGTLVSCSTPGTTTGTGYATTLGWTMTLGLNSEFSTLGFGVTESETYSVSNSFDCNNVAHEGGSICVLFYQAITAFTVRVKEHIVCGCGISHTSDRGIAVVYAPNDGKVGSIAGRGINVEQHGVEQCYGDDDRDIHYYCGPPGGPEWWRGRAEGPWVDDYVNQREPPGCEIPIEARRYFD